jgi:elongation factor Tu
MAARFALDGMFTLTGRGLVLTGQITEGVIRVGDHVRLPSVVGVKLARIANVEMGHRRTLDGSPGGFVGLVLDGLTPDETSRVRAALSPGQELPIEAAF